MSIFFNITSNVLAFFNNKKVYNYLVYVTDVIVKKNRIAWSFSFFYF